jgi:hypothetical protein
MTPTIEVAIDSLISIGQDLSWVGDGMAEIKGELASLNLRSVNYVKALRFRPFGYEIVPEGPSGEIGGATGFSEPSAKRAHRFVGSMSGLQGGRIGTGKQQSALPIIAGQFGGVTELRSGFRASSQLFQQIATHRVQ